MCSQVFETHTHATSRKRLGFFFAGEPAYSSPQGDITYEQVQVSLPDPKFLLPIQYRPSELLQVPLSDFCCFSGHDRGSAGAKRLLRHTSSQVLFPKTNKIHRMHKFPPYSKCGQISVFAIDLQSQCIRGSDRSDLYGKLVGFVYLDWKSCLADHSCEKKGEHFFFLIVDVTFPHCRSEPETGNSRNASP